MISSLALVYFVVALTCFHLVSNALKPGVRALPGPWLAKITELYRVLMVVRGRFSYELVDLHRKYGPVVRVGPNAVSLSDPRLVDEIYSTRTSYPKSDWVKSSQTLYQGKEVPALMTTQDVGVHLSLKRSIASAYSVTTLLGYEEYVEDTVQLFLRRIEEEFIKTGAICPLHEWLQWYAYDVIGMITMSRPMGLLEAGKDVDNMLGELKVESDYRAAAAVMPIIDYISRKNPIIRRFRAPTHRIMIRARAMLDERLAQESKSQSNERQDFISRFLEAKEQHPDVLGDRNMLGFVGSNLQAGSDTTAIVLRTILYFVLKTPGVLQRMHAELDAFEGQRPLKFQQSFNELPYTKAVVQESLRIHPPFALLLERQVPPQGLTLPDGLVLPQGTKVGMFGYTMHLNKDIYGDDAEYFNPDRWLQRDDEQDEAYMTRVRDMSYYDLSFSKGKRACIGRHVAELQIYKFIPAIIETLNIELVDPSREWKVEQKFFSLQSGLNVRIKWRRGRGLTDKTKEYRDD